MISEELIFRDEKMFFNIVQTTGDDVEAEDLLRRARTAVSREKAARVASGDTRQDQALGMLLTRLNDELHYLSQRTHRISVKNAVIAVLGKDAWDQVTAYRVMNDPKANQAA